MKDIEKFLEAICEEDFVEGHEVLEDRWRELKKNPETLDESKILKGLINGSTALALKIMGKETGAKTVWSTFEKYRPLIQSVPCVDTANYKIAEKMLDDKYQKYMI
ncbi:DUF309 domain-containing protein [Sulfurospirillum sp. 1612]|uniref:DUF309 domain-containing protein n=1 Tax=Sulfurospirillum sp. 1612 TaxID=3094835 RepID=UPI002F94D600